MKKLKLLRKLTALIVICILWLGLSGQNDLAMDATIFPKEDKIVRFADVEFMTSILFFYSQYETECHNDSTYKGFGSWLSDGGDKWWGTLDENQKSIYGGYHRYSHRQPTFSGFIDFLRSKQP